MIKASLFLFLALAGTAFAGGRSDKYEQDVFASDAGDLKITFIGHSSLIISYGGKIIHVDPFGGGGGRYEDLPKADLVLITHEHFDHLDPDALKLILRPGTEIVASSACAKSLPEAIILANGETRTVQGISLQAVPAYNIHHKRPDGNPFHPRGRGNGYILTLGGKRTYIAGDTEFIPEMKSLGHVDIAFLPMNLPYTMSPEMTAEAAAAVSPAILYPYHFGDTDTRRLVELLKNRLDIEIRIRKMS